MKLFSQLRNYIDTINDDIQLSIVPQSQPCTILRIRN